MNLNNLTVYTDDELEDRIVPDKPNPEKSLQEQINEQS
jgi:hypothetical protein